MLLRKYRNHIKKCTQYFFLLFAFLLSNACSTQETPIIVPESTEVETDFVLSFGSDEGPSTYALDATKEEEVGEVTVFAFRDVNGTEYFSQASATNQYTTDPTSGKRVFTLTFKVTTLNHRFIVIANANSEVAAYTNVATTISKAELLTLLISQNANKWATGASYRKIPMWGESTNTYPITAAGLVGSNAVDVKMLRALASVDIVSNLNTSLFEVVEAYVYNRYTNGRIAPIVGNYTVTGTDIEATVASIPTTPNIVMYPGALPTDRQPYGDDYKYKDVTTGTYKYNDQTVSYNQLLVNQIYLYEATAKTDDIDATCLVIGGKYNGSATTTYYRADFLASGAYKPILRNHKYIINITGATEAGYDGPDDAFEKKVLDSDLTITLTVVDWDAVAVITQEPQEYDLTVSQSSISIPSASYEGVVTVNTTYSEGWGATTSSAGLTFLNSTGASAGTTLSGQTGTQLRFQISSGSGPWTIKVTAGQLSKTITISL